MNSYITTVFNLITGLVDADKLVLIALVGLGIVLVWQLFGLLFSRYSSLARKCRKISKFLTIKGLSANNYNEFLSLVAKMPQEFIRGYKTFEHASYGLPSDYIKRFESIDVESNGGMLNHGKSFAKAFIYCFTFILVVLSVALLGSDTAITGFALAEALVLPLLFLIVARLIYFVCVAVQQQQYRVAVDEFNEMLDIMNERIENNDNLPGPDILAYTEEDLGQEPGALESKEEVAKEEQKPEEDNDEVTYVEPLYGAAANEAEKEEAEPETEKDELEKEVVSEPALAADFEQAELAEKQIEENNEEFQEEPIENETENFAATEELSEENEEVEDVKEAENEQVEEDETSAEETVVSEEELEETVPADVQTENTLVADAEIQLDEIDDNSREVPPEEKPAEVALQEEFVAPVEEEPVEETEQDGETKNRKPRQSKKVRLAKKGEDMENEPKRGRGRPRKVPEGELVITNDKQFEEALERAEKLMRKSQEALSSSQAKRVEKALKELVDAMTAYKEQQ